MRRSLPRTPHSGLSSRVAPLSAVLREGVGVRENRPRVPRRPATRSRAGSAASQPPRPLAVVSRADQYGSRLRLLEGFLNRSEVADCAQFALQWLGEVLGVTQSLCLVRPSKEQTLFTAATYGLPGAVATMFSVSLED